MRPFSLGGLAPQRLRKSLQLHPSRHLHETHPRRDTTANLRPLDPQSEAMLRILQIAYGQNAS